MNYTFDQLSGLTVDHLISIRDAKRTILSEEIQKRDALKAEILYLQTKINKYISSTENKANEPCDT